jgi:hypothetical protein
MSVNTICITNEINPIFHHTIKIFVAFRCRCLCSLSMTHNVFHSPIDLENGGHKEFEYFKATQPKHWSFVGFYTFRERQTDFSKLFNLEAFKLRKALNHLLENGSTEEKAYATTLFEALKVMTRSSDWSEAQLKVLARARRKSRGKASEELRFVRQSFHILRL